MRRYIILRTNVCLEKSGNLYLRRNWASTLDGYSFKFDE